MWFTRTDKGFRGWFQAVRTTGQLRAGAPSGSFVVDIIDYNDTNSIQVSASESGNVLGNYYFDVPSSFLITSGAGDYNVSVQVAIPGPQAVTDSFGKVLHVTEEDFDSLRDVVITATEYQRGAHTAETYLYVDLVNGNDSNNGEKRATPKQTITNALSSVTQEHTAIILLGNSAGQQVFSENITLSNRYTFIRGPGLDTQIIGAADSSPTITINASGCEISGIEVTTLETGTPDAIQVNADFTRLRRLRILNPRRHGINCLDADRLRVEETIIEGAGQSGVGNGLLLSGSSFALINFKSLFTSSSNDNIVISAGAATASNNLVDDCTITNSLSGFGINIQSGESNRLTNLSFSKNSTGDISNSGTGTVIHNTVLDNYEGLVHIDTSSGFTGLSYPNGTLEVPVNNYSDAKTIADLNGFREFHLINGVLTLTSSLNEWVVFGETPESEVAFSNQSVNGSRFSGLKVSGIMNGNVSINDGIIEDVSNFFGFASFCGLSGDTALGDGESTFDRCHSQEPGSKLPTLLFDGANRTLNMRAYSGGIKIEEMSDPTNSGTIEFVAGAVEIDASCTDGELIIRGIVDVVDNSAGTTVVVEAALARSPIADVVWDESLDMHNSVAGTAGRELALQSYLDGIWIEPNNGTAGTIVGVNGTPSNPVDTLADAEVLADATGFRKFHVLTGLLTLDRPFTEWTFEGHAEVEIRFNGQNINASQFVNALIKGDMSGTINVANCMVEDVNSFRGTMTHCGIDGMVMLNSGESSFADCYSLVPGSATPTIDFGNSGASLNVRGYKGGITLANKAGGGSVSLDLSSGQIVLENTITNGILELRGVGDLTDNSAGATVNSNALINLASITDVVWDENLPGDHDISGSSGKLLQTAGTGGVDTDLLAGAVWNRDPSLHLISGTMGWIQNKELVMSSSIDKIRAFTCGRWALSGSQMVFFDDDNVTEVGRFNMLDTEGDPFFSEANAPAERVVTGSA